MGSYKQVHPNGGLGFYKVSSPCELRLRTSMLLELLILRIWLSIAVWVGSSDVEVADKIVAYHLGSGALCVKLWHVTVHLDTTGPGQFGETDFMEREQSGMEESPRPASVKWNYKLDDNESIGDFDEKTAIEVRVKRLTTIIAKLQHLRISCTVGLYVLKFIVRRRRLDMVPAI